MFETLQFLGPWVFLIAVLWFLIVMLICLDVKARGEDLWLWGFVAILFAPLTLIIWLIMRPERYYRQAKEGMKSRIGRLSRVDYRKHYSLAGLQGFEVQEFTPYREMPYQSVRSVACPVCRRIMKIVLYQLPQKISCPSCGADSVVDK